MNEPHTANYDAGYRAGLIEAADMVNRERASHLIASTRAPAAGALFRVEQALRTRALPPGESVA